MKQNGLKTSFGRVDKKAPVAWIKFSLPTDAEDYEYPYKIQVVLSVHNIFEIHSRDSCTKKI
jgi:hypothetical protein